MTIDFTCPSYRVAADADPRVVAVTFWNAAIRKVAETITPEKLRFFAEWHREDPLDAQMFREWADAIEAAVK